MPAGALVSDFSLQTVRSNLLLFKSHLVCGILR